MKEDIIRPIPDLFATDPDWEAYVDELVNLLIQHGFDEDEAWDIVEDEDGMVYVSYEDGEPLEDVAFWLMQ